jgi:hypothetical protein
LYAHSFSVGVKGKPRSPLKSFFNRPSLELLLRRMTPGATSLYSSRRKRDKAKPQVCDGGMFIDTGCSPLTIGVYRTLKCLLRQFTILAFVTGDHDDSAGLAQVSA